MRKNAKVNGLKRISINKITRINDKATNIFLGVLAIAAVAAYLMVVILFFDPFYNLANCATYFLAIFICLYGVVDFFRNGLKIANAFLISFYFFLAVNCLGLSYLQRPKTLLDMYYFFFGPVLFYCALSLLENMRINIKKRITLKIQMDWVNWGLLVAFCGLYLFVFATKGIRLFSTTLKSEQARLFVIPGVSGLIDMLGWTLLMLSLNAKNKHLKWLMIVVPVLFTLLNASRTLTMRMGAFVVCLFLFSRGKKISSIKLISLILVIAILVVVLFGVWGNYRERISGWSNLADIGISTALESKVDNDILGWLYGYSAINYDVLKQRIIEREFTVPFRHLFVPIIRAIGGSEAVGAYNAEIGKAFGKSLNGFNATTFLASPIMELREFYFIELLLLALIIGVCVMLSRAVGFRGAYVYFTMASIMSVFGDYYIDINGDYAIILGLLVCVLVNQYPTYTEKQEVKKQPEKGMGKL